MPEEGRRRATYEPGHRYSPRRPLQRLFDVAPARRNPVTVQQVPVSDAPQSQEPKSTSESQPQHVAHDLTSHTVQKPPVKPIMPSGTNNTRVRSVHPHFASKPAVPRQKKSMVLRRQIRDHAEMHSRINRSQKQRFVLAFGFGGLVTGFVLLGAFLVYGKNLSGNRQVLSATTQQASAGGPSEFAISRADVDSYTVPGNQPRVIHIPRIDVRARVYPVQASLNGEPLPAPNIYDVGWFGEGVVPGSAGAALFNGSSSGPTKHGVFSGLSNLSVGDEIIVERGDGTELTFTVISSKGYDSDKVDMKAAVQPAIAGKPGLNLLTDIGRFNVRTNTFEQRLLIRSVLKN